MKTVLSALRIFLVLTVLTGVIYPALVSLYSETFVREKAKGSLIYLKDEARGSRWIGQKFSQDKYFWSRPSAIDYNSTVSGGSNLGPTSKSLQVQFEERKKKISTFAPTGPVPPSDLLFASGSGLDPEISPSAALWQVERVARVRGLSSDVVRQLVNEFTESPQYGIFGEERVNVLQLNLALEQL